VLHNALIASLVEEVMNSYLVHYSENEDEKKTEWLLYAGQCCGPCSKLSASVTEYELSK
jgi:hypothetical protein